MECDLVRAQQKYLDVRNTQMQATNNGKAPMQHK